MDLPAREERLTFPELRRFCEVSYYHIMRQSTHLADPATVLSLDGKEPNNSRLCWGAPLFESDVVVEAVVELLHGSRMSSEILPLPRSRGSAEAATTVRKFLIHFMCLGKYLHFALKTFCILPSSICMNRPPVYGLYIVQYVLSKSGLKLFRVTRISLNLNVRIVSKQKQISIQKVFISSQFLYTILDETPRSELKQNVRRIRRRMRKEKKKQRNKE